MSTRSSTTLRCSVCGGSQPGSSTIEQEGWFACRHCGEVATIPGAGVLVTTAPGGGVKEIARPGRRELITSHSFDSVPSTLASLILAEFVGSTALRILRNAAPHLLGWVGAPLYMVLIGVVGYLTLRRFRRAHVKVTDDGRLRAWRQVGPWRSEQKETTLTLLRMRKEPTVAGANVAPSLVLSREPDVKIEIPFDSFRDRDWVAPRLVSGARATTAVDLERELTCDGCGGELGSCGELREANRITCPHCGTGLLYTHGGVRLPPLERSFFEPREDIEQAPHPTPVKANAKRAKVSRARDALVIELPGPTWRASNWGWMAFLGLIVYGLSFPAGWLVDHWVFAPIVTTMGLALTIAPGLIIVHDIVDHWFVHREAELTRTSFEIHRRLGRHRFRSQRFAIARLLKLRAHEDAMRTFLEVQCATRSAEFVLPTREPAIRDALARLFDEIEERVEALGRAPAHAETVGAS